MKLLAGYDLDGVLAASPPPASKKWGQMNGPERQARRAALVGHYAAAAPMYMPSEGRFDVITARKDEPAVRKATEQWLKERFGPRVRALRMLKDSRSIKNVVAFKAAAIQELEITDFTEDNPLVVRQLAALRICRVWLFASDVKGTTISLQQARLLPGQRLST